MADLQTQFNRFHETIKIDFDGNKPLRDKRDIILNALRTGLKKKFPTNTPSFDFFNQGSYDMSTGTEPLEGNDYDIDVGIVFNFAKDNYDPVNIKKIVFDILDAAYQRKVEVKRPCVRVQYHLAGEKAYHIDLAIYAKGKDFFGNLNNTLYIAKGKLNSLSENKLWEISEPYQLKELIKSKISDNSDRDQFRRVIRYLKRWKDYNSSFQGNGRPTGIALTALCYNHFTVEKTLSFNSSTNKIQYKYNDLQALTKIVNAIISDFTWSNKIIVQLPVRPYNNLFAKMTDNQMLIVKTQLQNFRVILNNANSDTQTTMACMRLRSVFGGDFPSS
jgi:hypothetical protein